MQAKGNEQIEAMEEDPHEVQLLRLLRQVSAQAAAEGQAEA